MTNLLHIFGGKLAQTSLPMTFMTYQTPSQTQPVLSMSSVIGCVRRTPGLLYAVALVPAALVLVLVSVQQLVPVDHLTRDPMVVVGKTGIGKAYYGMLSNLGILAWSAAVGAGMLGAAALYRSGRARKKAAFLAFGAALGAMLAVDDLFMIHESRYFGGERVLLAIYGAATLGYLALFWKNILISLGGGLLLLALGLFALSLSVDLIVDEAAMTPLLWIVEDGAKFLGITTWATFQFIAAVELIGSAMTPSSQP
jgi:hypothetical protein